MSGEQVDRGFKDFFHHQKKETQPRYAEDGSVIVETTEVNVTEEQEDGVTKARHEVKRHQTSEYIGEAAAVAAGAYALFEKHQAKKDPEHAHRHKIAEEIAGVAAVGAGGFAWHEHHEKKHAKEGLEGEGEKKHNLF